MEILPKDKLLNLSGKTAIVTGGSLGIGYGISYRLAEAGANVVVTSRNIEDVNKAVEELKQKGFKAVGVKTDVSLEADVKNLVLEVVKSFGSIDILVNNAGMFPFAPLSQLTSEIFDKVIATNLKGVFLTTKYISEQMIKQGKGGKIINITSIDSLHPSSIGLAHYDASKHGVWGFTKNFALEVAKQGIRVNAIAPGGIATEGVAKMSAGADKKQMAEQIKIFTEKIPLGRFGEPDDIATAALFLCSDASAYMTGAMIIVDGGVLLT